MQLSFKNILVCGGSGFIGSNFIRYIYNKYPDCKIFNLDLLTYAGNPANLADIEEKENKRNPANQRCHFFRGDICDGALLANIFEKYNFDAVINFAAESHVDRSFVSVFDFIRTNVEGVRSLIEATRKYKVSRFVQISTDEIYGSVPEGFSTEDAPLKPSNPYAASKAAADLLVQSYIKTHQVPALIVRGSNNYGPFQYPEKLIPLAISNIIEGIKVPIHGSGEHRRTWIHVNDFCSAIDTALHKAPDYSIYNASGEEKTNLEIQNNQLEIDRQHEEIVNQKNKMSSVLKTIDKLDHQQSYLEILILKGSLGNFFKEVNELQTLENGLKDDLSGLEESKIQLENKKNLLEARKSQLSQLKEKITENTEKISVDKKTKDQLLTSTKGQESNFQKLLAEVQAEQAKINSDIQNLEIEARKKLAEKNGTLPADDGFIWPVASRKVTAYFHDPEYPFRYIFEHPAIDIGATPQGTPIRAAGSGYVAKVQFRGDSSYAYLMIVHADGLSTVYGHISKPYVSQDNFVVQGEVIALSGGSLGGIGSGNLTTAPHLHFEVRLNGIPVDPLKYLP